MSLLENVVCVLYLDPCTKKCVLYAKTCGFYPTQSSVWTLFSLYIYLFYNSSSQIKPNNVKNINLLSVHKRETLLSDIQHISCIGRFGGFLFLNGHDWMFIKCTRFCIFYQSDMFWSSLTSYEHVSGNNRVSESNIIYTWFSSLCIYFFI